MRAEVERDTDHKKTGLYMSENTMPKGMESNLESDRKTESSFISVQLLYGYHHFCS